MVDQSQEDTQLAKAIVDAIGGSSNVTSVIYCATRLRFTLKDLTKVDKPNLENLSGVLGTQIKGNQLQVVIGTHVARIFQVVESVLGESGSASGGAKVNNSSNQNSEVAVKKFNPMVVLDVLTSIISPIIPAFCACGMMKVLLLLLETLQWVDTESGAYQVFSWISDAAFYFLPILVAVGAAKRFNTDTGLALCVAGALLYPSFTALIDSESTVEFLGINVPLYSYSTTIFPALLGVLLLSYVQKFLNKIIRIEILRTLVVPLLCLGITIPLTYLLIAPIGNWLAEGLGFGLNWLISTFGPFAGLIIGFFVPLLTLTGLHQSLGPIEFLEMSTLGFTRILPIEYMHNIAESGAALGTAVATKDKKFRAIAISTGTTALLGVSEPALYGVMVRERYSMLSAMIANAVGGFLALLFSLRMFAYVWPNIFSAPAFLGESDDSITTILLKLVLSIFITFAIGFILPIIFKRVGLSDFGSPKKSDGGEIFSPIAGRVIPITEVEDRVFADKVVGDGVAIIPTSNLVISPVSGTVATLSESGHALGIESSDGAEILLHFGIDTVELGDKLPVKKFIKVGDKVERGQRLLEVDFPAILQAGYKITTPVLITNVANAKNIQVKTGEVEAGDVPVITYQMNE